jgi:hypothetical protein
MTVTYSGTITFNATGTLTTAGKTIGPITISGSGITTTLGDALTSSGFLTVTQGTFTTNNYAVTAQALSSGNSNTRTINFGSSTITLTNANGIVAGTNTNLTFNAGTSQINLTASDTSITGGAASGTGLTFYNVAFTSTTSGTNSIVAINTFNNLTITARSTAGVTEVTFNSRQTINGTLSTTGTAGNRRVWFRGATYGLAQTLTINSAPSLTDADFRDIYVIGTAAPISGTRIGDLRGIRGITASTPKTVYWNLAAGGNWSANAWAASSGGAVSTDNFPLAQDTAVIENTGLNTSATVTLDSPITYIGSLNMSTRTNAMTFSASVNPTFYGNLTLGSGVTYNANLGTMTLSGRNTQIITSAGKTLGDITLDSYGGVLELADALNIGSRTLTVTNGTFDTKNYNVTAGSLSSSNSNVRTITLGSSTLTLSGTGGPSMNVSTNLTFNAGTSQINITAENINLSFSFGGLTYYNVTFTGVGAKNIGMATTATTTFNNLTITAPSGAGLIQFVPSGNFIINGTLTCAGATAVRRIFLRSDTLGTTRTLTVNSLSATDCDFRDITIAGAAAGSSPTRAGNCGGNTGIAFPSPKTVYWNLAGTQNWSATAWAPSSGGTPDINQFPLAQDTAVFDNTGSAGTITTNAAWNIGTLNMSGRTSACTIDWSNSGPFYHGNVLLGSGVTPGTTGAPTFAGRGTQTITSGGNIWSGAITIDSATGTVQLADALTLIAARTLTLTSGTFDAVTYNVTTGSFAVPTFATTLKMGSGTWTLSSTGNLWNFSSNPVLYKGTANIVLSNTSATNRTFRGGGLSYNKLTIGGSTGTSTLIIEGDNQFTELASTKTVAHTIDLGSTTQTFGKWTVTGTAGNVVTLSGTGTSHVLAGAATSGIDYLAMGSIGFSATSPGEFYAGANSTGTASAPVFRTATPAATTRYWVGGTGNWSDTNRWSTGSGGGGGASVPTSLDNVIFDAASNATAYTATVNATSRCNQLTIAGPASGNVTLAGTSTLICHGNITLPATGLTRTFTGLLVLSGSTTGKTFTTNGVTVAGNPVVNGVGCGWSLGSAWSDGAAGTSLTVTNGDFDTANYAVTIGGFASSNANTRSLSLGSSTISIQSLPTGFTNSINLTLNAGTSQINCSSNSVFNGGGLSFYNVNFTNTSSGTVTINGANSFNNLSFTGITSAGLKVVSVSANQTITGTLTLSAGTNATMRHFVRSDTIGTTRTLTCAAVSATDADFRDITIAGAAAPASGTRLGDCKGNSGITFPVAKTVWWGQSIGDTWGSGNARWSLTNGGTPAINNFPLAQDTAVFPSSPTPFPSSGNTITINAAYNIGTIDMSARTTNTMTLATGAQTPTIYGNWINGTGTTFTGSGVVTLAGRGSQTVTSAGVTFTQPFTVNTPGGSVTLQDAFTSSNNISHTQGTLDTNGFSATLSSLVLAQTTLSRTLAIGTSTVTLSGGFTYSPSTVPTTFTGTGTISLTNASAKTFAGGGVDYTNITLNQGGAGALTITGNNTFKDITNTYKSTGAANITLGTTTQRVSQWTGAGEAGRLLTVQGTSASSPGTLILTSGTVNVDYLTITGVRAYSLTDTWYAGANSTNNGSLGWIFSAAPAAASTGNFFLMFWPT